MNNTVLVVNDDPTERVVLGEWLERVGYDVLTCPGPTAPDYVCIGGRTMRCPLAASVPVVVLDMRLGGDIAMEGTPAWHVLVTYVGMGKQVVALVGDEDPVRPRPDDQVTLLSRPASRARLLEAVYAACERAKAAV